MVFRRWSEYRDVLLICKKGSPPKEHHVKFALVKKDLRRITKKDVEYIRNQLENNDDFRSSELDIESFSMSELLERFANLMWFCGVTDFQHRDKLVSFTRRFSKVLLPPPANCFKEGYRPVPKGVSSFMFITRALDPCRTEEAFLFFDSANETNESVKAQSLLQIDYKIEKNALLPSLRTGIGINTLDITKKLDYIAKGPYKEFGTVLKASGFKKPKHFNWVKYWLHVKQELSGVKTKFVTVHRINPYSPNTNLIAFFSEEPFFASNVLNIVKEDDEETAKAFCALMNSIIFLAQFFLLKEETTGRYINIRFYDFYEMSIFPERTKIKALATVFDAFAHEQFPSLREQLDKDFDARYDAFWLETKKKQKTLFSVAGKVSPSEIRADFDIAICNALGISITKEELLDLYKVLVQEMIVTRGLTRD